MSDINYLRKVISGVPVVMAGHPAVVVDMTASGSAMHPDSQLSGLDEAQSGGQDVTVR